MGSVFLMLSIISLGFSLVLYLKSCAIKKIPKNLTATVFNKTFNVFDPSSEHHRTFQSYFVFILLSPLVAFSWTFIFVFIVFLQILEAGLVGELAIFILCLGLLMMSEATEAYSIANTLVKAAERQTSFGQGDIYVFSILKKTIGKLSVYYLLLAILFAALFFTMPYIFPALMLTFSQFIGLILGATIGIPLVAPFAAALLFILFTLAVFVAATKVRATLFGFLHPDVFQTDEIMARWILHERI